MEATEPHTMDDVIEMIANPKSSAPETTEEESEVSDTEEIEAEASEEDTTEAETDAEAETDEADADEADEEESAEDEAEDPEEDDEPDLITVTVDGTERAVTLDELKRGYSGQAKIQEDLAKNAQTRKQLEQAAQAMMDQQNEILQLRQRVEQGGFKAPPQAPDKRLLDTNPAQYMRERAAYEDAVAEFQQEQAQFQQLSERQAAYQRHQQAQQVAAQFEALKERIPEMADEKTAPEFARKLLNAGTEYGFSPEELGGITDARALEVLRDAAEMRALRAKQGTKKAPPKPTRSVKAKAPVRRSPTDAEKARRTMRRSGSVDDVAAFLLSKK